MAKRVTKRPKAPRKKSPATKAPAKPAPRSMIVHVLSDSTGNLAQHMLAAFLTQFPPDTFQLRRLNFLQTPTQLSAAMDRVAADKGVVFHALVSPQAKAQVQERCRQIGVPCCDLTGEFVQFLAKVSGIRPQANVYRLHDVSHEYHQRIKALEFTLEHDDAMNLDTIHLADIVLAGVSRTSKTPTSIYLAQQGYRVANVSLIADEPVPRQLLQLPARNVVGLILDPHQLAEIRRTRQAEYRMGSTSYADESHVEHEVLWSRRLFIRQGWPILDVTGRAVEETAARVVNILGLGNVG